MQPSGIELDRSARAGPEEPLEDTVEVPRQFLMESFLPGLGRLLLPERVGDLPIQLVGSPLSPAKILGVSLVMLDLAQQSVPLVDLRLVPGDLRPLAPRFLGIATLRLAPFLLQ